MPEFSERAEESPEGPWNPKSVPFKEQLLSRNCGCLMREVGKEAQEGPAKLNRMLGRIWILADCAVWPRLGLLLPAMLGCCAAAWSRTSAEKFGAIETG